MEDPCRIHIQHAVQQPALRILFDRKRQIVFRQSVHRSTVHRVVTSSVMEMVERHAVGMVGTVLA
jgi:hypothetical protein